MNRTQDRREKKYNKVFLDYFTVSEREQLGRILSTNLQNDLACYTLLVYVQTYYI